MFLRFPTAYAISCRNCATSFFERANGRRFVGNYNTFSQNDNFARMLRFKEVTSMLLLSEFIFSFSSSIETMYGKNDSHNSFLALVLEEWFFLLSISFYDLPSLAPAWCRVLSWFSHNPFCSPFSIFLSAVNPLYHLSCSVNSRLSLTQLVWPYALLL